MISELWRRLQRLFFRSSFDRELEEEIQLHVDLRAARLGDLSAARKLFGNDLLVKETSRDVWGWGWMEDLGKDLRYALRMLRRSPAFTAVVVLTLALGIGANTAIYSLVDAVLLRMLPVRDPQRLVELTRVGGGTLSYPLFEAIRDRSGVFSGALAVAGGRFGAGVSIGGVEVGDIHYSEVSGSYFQTLGVAPALGRSLTEEDLVRPDTAVIGDGLWTRAFARDPGVLGRAMQIGDRSVTIVGVAPRGFTGVALGQPVDLWVPITWMDGKTLHNRFAFVLRIMARMKPGVTEQEARANVAVLLTQISADWKLERPMTFELTPASGGLTALRRRFSRPLMALMALVGLVLLIASVNVANLLLARASARQKEMAVRLSIGASRRRLLRQLLTESTLLALFGGALGLLLAVWARSALVTFVSSALTPVELSFDLDYRILGFTAIVSLLTGLLFGLAPALAGTSPDLTPLIKGSAPAAQGQAGMRPGKLLVVAQVGVSCVLLAGAVLFSRSLHNLTSLDLGFDPERVLLLRTDLTRGAPKGVERAQLLETVMERLAAVPGVRSVSLSSEALLQGNAWTEAVRAPGYNPRPGDDREATILVISPSFFETMRTPLLRGRAFSSRDREGAPRVAIVNEAMARYYFGNSDPIGRVFRLEGEAFPEPLTIVGVAKDTKYRNLRQSPPRLVYAPMRQAPLGMATMEVRTAADPAKMTDLLWNEAQRVSTVFRIGGATTQIQLVESTIVQDRLLARLSGVFGGLAAALICLGLYGVTSYAVSRRTAEMGIRIALGAQRGDVLRMVLGESMVPVIGGVAIGLLAALGFMRLVESLLFGVGGGDPVALGLAAALITAIAAVSAYLPARRASSVDPMIALRYE